MIGKIPEIPPVTKETNSKSSQGGAKLLPIRQQQKLMTHERLLDAAVQVFLERGYADATIDDIVAAAAVGRATFYLHFKSKPEVMRDIIQAREDQNEELIQELDADQCPTRASLETWLKRFVGHWADNGDRFLVGLQALASEPELSNQLEAGFQLTSNILSNWMVVHRGLPAEEAALRAELLVGALQRACRALVTQPDHFDVDLVTRVVADIWATNLLP